MKPYGKELVLDLHDCNINHYNCTRKFLKDFCVQLCDLIDMERGTIHFWDFEGNEEEYNNSPPHLKGTSCVQFIKTSNITIHALDEMKRVYLNIFSCKNFNEDDATAFCKDYFGGTIKSLKVFNRE